MNFKLYALSVFAVCFIATGSVKLTDASTEEIVFFGDGVNFDLAITVPSPDELAAGLEQARRDYGGELVGGVIDPRLSSVDLAVTAIIEGHIKPLAFFYEIVSSDMDIGPGVINIHWSKFLKSFFVHIAAHLNAANIKTVSLLMRAGVGFVLVQVCHEGANKLVAFMLDPKTKVVAQVPACIKDLRGVSAGAKLLQHKNRDFLIRLGFLAQS